MSDTHLLVDAPLQAFHRDPWPCSVCGRDMVDHETGSSMNGAFCSVAVVNDGPELADFGAAFRRIYPDLPFPLQVAVCYVCWLKSLGLDLAALNVQS